MSRLPSRLETPRLLLRHWTEDDADALSKAINESLEHLRPWMEWIEHEPLTLEGRKEGIRQWRREWSEGDASTFGIFLGSTVVGSTGLTRRSGPETLEIGYWLHVGHTGKGYATEVVRALTHAAFGTPGIEVVEIRTDRANLASARVPQRLGYTLSGETTREPDAPGVVGIDQHWVMKRDDWEIPERGA
jgi:RimJ/RimL family protein N-acetyltransferase